MKITIFITTIIATVVVSVMQSQLIIPIKIQEQTKQTESKMKKMGFPMMLASSIDSAASKTNLSPEFLVALMHSESGFDKKAISRKGYKGLMQVPYSIYDEDVNTLIGAKIFEEKLALTRGNMVDAIILYKGYANDRMRGKKQAEKVIRLYHQLKEMDG